MNVVNRSKIGLKQKLILIKQDYRKIMIHPEEYVPVMITSTHPDLLTDDQQYATHYARSLQKYSF